MTQVTQIFVNLPVKDLDRAVAFFTKLGFTFNPQFTDKNATCMIIGDNIFAMLLVEPFFRSFLGKKEIADRRTSTTAIVALSLPSREAVDRMSKDAFAAGGVRYKEPADHGWMYQWGFEDQDGHLWELFYADPKGPS